MKCLEFNLHQKMMYSSVFCSGPGWLHCWEQCLHDNECYCINYLCPGSGPAPASRSARHPGNQQASTTSNVTWTQIHDCRSSSVHRKYVYGWVKVQKWMLTIICVRWQQHEIMLLRLKVQETWLLFCGVKFFTVDKVWCLWYNLLSIWWQWSGAVCWPVLRHAAQRTEASMRLHLLVLRYEINCG